jgi:tRNA G26 N,N-dimethylase Trm1
VIPVQEDVGITGHHFIFRAAARYNKGLVVLCSVAFKSSFTVLVTVKRGSAHANKSIQNIRKLIHCSMCEDRAFYPDTNYPIGEYDCDFLHLVSASWFRTLCCYMTPEAIARQLLGKLTPMAMNIQATIEELLEGVFYRQSVLKLHREAQQDEES